MKTHEYSVTVKWADRNGTSDYRSYPRDHDIVIEGKKPLPASSDTIFRGDGSRYNPEDMLVASLSSCHMLWYLHLCADAGVIVTSYEDKASATLSMGGEKEKFTSATLRPKVTVKEESMVERAMSLHGDAHASCFIANSCNFPVYCEPEVRVIEGDH